MRTSQLPLEDQYWFSYINIGDFRERSLSMYLRYTWMYVSLVGWPVLLLAEVFVGVCLVILQDWAHTVVGAGLTSQENIRALYNTNADGSSPLSPPSSAALSPSSVANAISQAAAFIILGSIALSIGVYIWDWIQARTIKKSDSIPEAYLHQGAFQLWSAQSYSHFCLLSKIDWGRSFKQRIVLMTYFALQVMYICVIVSIAGAPGWGVGLFGDALPVFAQKFSSTQLTMLRAMLFIVIVAITVLLFELLRMLFFLILWLSSIHKHQETQKTMYRDLQIRIETLLLSACWSSNTDKSAAAASSGQESIHSKTSSAVPISWDPAGRNASSTPPPPLPVPQQQHHQQQLQQQQQQANAERAAALSRSRSKLNLPSHVRKKSLGERTRTELQQAAVTSSHNLQDLRTQMSDEYDVRSSVALRILDTASATSEYLFTEDLPMVALQQPDHNNNNINNYHRGASSTNVNSTVAAAIASTNNLNNTNHVGSHVNHKSGN
ncbi:hypothetical protein BGW42_003185, partial [Actinomortierella wolfii]